VIPTENRHAVPGTFALPNCAITQRSKGIRWKCPLLSFKFLETNDVWLCFAEPSHQVIQPLVDVVDIESGDLQYKILNRRLAKGGPGTGPSCRARWAWGPPKKSASIWLFFVRAHISELATNTSKWI
jgi:hypothetical protein